MTRYVASIISITVALSIGALSPPAEAKHVATMYCNYISNGGKPFVSMHFRMYSFDDFSNTVEITYLREGKTYKETLKPEQPVSNELFGFTISKEMPKYAQHLSIFDEVVNPDDAVERWHSIVFSVNDDSHAMAGSCYVN